MKALTEGEAMLAAGKTVAEVHPKLGVAESIWMRWKKQFSGMKSEEANRTLISTQWDHNRFATLIQRIIHRLCCYASEKSVLDQRLLRDCFCLSAAWLPTARMLP